MFSKEQISAYQNISAPSELRNKVLDVCSVQKRKIPTKPLVSFAAMAACLILCIGLSLHYNAAEPKIFCNGQQLEDSLLFYDISPASDMRTSPVFSIPFEFSLEKETEISVSHGTLLLADGSHTQSATLVGEQTIWWEIPREDEMPKCEMLLTEKRESTLICLTYNNEEKTVTATKTSQS